MASKMHWESYRPDELVKRIWEFKLARENGIEKKQGPMLIVGGGGQRGAFGGGGVTALDGLALNNAFKICIGVSTGAPTVSYFLSGQAREGTSIYYEDNVLEEKFINFGREPIMDIDWLANLFLNGDELGCKRLNVNKIFENKTKLYFAVTNVSSGGGCLVDGKGNSNDPESLVLGIKASCSVPEIFGKSVRIGVDGKQANFVDGGVALPMPIEEGCKIVKPDCVVVFANRGKLYRENLWQRLTTYYSAWLLGDQFKKDILESDRLFRQEIKFLVKSKIPYVIFWTDDSIHALEQNPNKLRVAADNFEVCVGDFFNKYR